ncbi:MAG: site-2 protease family protein [Anaerolineales bacterium]
MLNLNPATLISRIIVLLTAFSVHEFAHAWTANYFGDSTPRINGRLTLNPLAHLDPMGSLLLVVAGFGWAKPVPVNPYTLRQRAPSALMWVALAGPLSNFLMAIIAALPFQLNLVTQQQLSSYLYGGNTGYLPTTAGFLVEFISINLVLMLFNLIPLPPLDGDKIVDYFLPDKWRDSLARIRPYGPMILIALFLVGPSLGIDIIGPPLRFLFNLLVR